MSKELLIIFTRNPELGRVKKRLSSNIGDAAALRVYNFLLEHTNFITKHLKVEKRMYYSDQIARDDLWNETIYSKRLQKGTDLGERMRNAFQEGFNDDYTNIILIGSDLFDLTQLDIENAFKELRRCEIVIGPAIDGGYYLIGMKQIIDGVFINKKWGSSSVLKDTLNDLHENSVSLMPEKNDIDYYEDLEQYEVLMKLL